VIEIMNKNFYRIVWNRTLGMFQVASEMARTEGKSSNINSPFVNTATKVVSVGRLAVMTMAIMMAWSLPASDVFAQTQVNTGWMNGSTGQTGEAGQRGTNGRNASLLVDPTSGTNGTNGGNGSQGDNGWSLNTNSATYINSGSVLGGTGGAGGSGGDGGDAGRWDTWEWRNVTRTNYEPGNGGDGGNGGHGGNGVSITASNVTFVNTGTVTGGNAGAAGAGGVAGEKPAIATLPGKDGNPGSPGIEGGYGIYVSGNNSDIINVGIISAGQDSSGNVTKESIWYGNSTSNSRLELRAGSDIKGIVNAKLSKGINILALGAGDGNYQGSFDVTQINNKYLGFNAFSK
ncbi:ESPR domain-containing protein, partial [Herbaspirillum sp. Sphag1AN]